MEQKPNDLWAFSMPDGNTWVGKWSDAKPQQLRDIVIFETPAKEEREDGRCKGFYNLKTYFARRYRSTECEDEARQARGGYASADHFNPNIAIAQFDLREEYGQTPKQR